MGFIIGCIVWDIMLSVNGVCEKGSVCVCIVGNDGQNSKLVILESNFVFYLFCNSFFCFDNVQWYVGDVDLKFDLYDLVGEVSRRFEIGIWDWMFFNFSCL